MRFLASSECLAPACTRGWRRRLRAEPALEDQRAREVCDRLVGIGRRRRELTGAQPERSGACHLSTALEVIGDQKTLFPDNEGLLEATRVLAKEGFVVLPYTNDDLVNARKLVDAGAAAVAVIVAVRLAMSPPTTTQIPASGRPG
jgi:hypothetical protein